AHEQAASEERAGGETEVAEAVADPQVACEFDTERIVARTQGREGWSREARRQLEQRRWEQPDHVPRSRDARLLLAAQRLEDERDAMVAANQAMSITARRVVTRRAGDLVATAASGSRRRYP